MIDFWEFDRWQNLVTLYANNLILQIINYSAFFHHLYRSGSSWLKITPFAIRDLLYWIKEKYNNPEIIVTENGFSDSAGNLDDMQRIYYYKHNVTSPCLYLNILSIHSYIVVFAAFFFF